MTRRSSRSAPRARVSILACAALLLAGCTGLGTKLQPPTASIQQLAVNSDGTWSAIVRFQNYSYDTGMHVYSIDANLTLDDKPAGHITLSPALDIPAMDADIATTTFKPDAAGAAARLDRHAHRVLDGRAQLGREHVPGLVHRDHLGLALGERLEAIPLNGAVVDEAVLVTAVRRDETKPLGVVEPLHLSGRTHIPLLKYIRYNTMLRGP